MLKLFQQRCCQRPNVFEPICLCAKQDDGERESCQILLIRNLSIDGHEHIKLLRGQGEEIAVLDSRPTAPLARW